MAQDDLLERLGRRVGAPAATVVVIKDSDDRRFIGESLLIAAALFLLKKYLDGVAERLGVKKLGEQHAELAIQTAKQAGELLRTQAEAVRRAVNEYIGELRRHPVDAAAESQGQESVAEHLVERGIPDRQARQIAREISDEVFNDR